MTKIITKTAEQYRQEQIKRDQDSICPNCGKRGFGFIDERDNTIIVMYQRTLSRRC